MRCVLLVVKKYFLGELQRNIPKKNKKVKKNEKNIQFFQKKFDSIYAVLNA